MILGINPKVDYAFKKLFGSPSHKGLLIHLLNSVLVGRLPAPLTDVEILNPFSVKVAPGDKLSILDVKARDTEGRLYLIEMQISPNVAFAERCLYYWSKRYVEQFREGQQYAELKPTILISFLDHELFEASGVHTVFHLRADEPAGLILSNHLEMHFVGLPKFHLAAGESRTALERWCFFLQHASEIDPTDLPEALETETIREAFRVLEQLAMTEAERIAYEERVMGLADHLSRQTDLAMREKRVEDLERRHKGIFDFVQKLKASERTAAGRSVKMAESEARLVEGELRLVENEVKLIDQEIKLASKEIKLIEEGPKNAESVRLLADQLNLQAERQRQLTERESALANQSQRLSQAEHRLGLARARHELIEAVWRRFPTDGDRLTERVWQVDDLVFLELLTKQLRAGAGIDELDASLTALLPARAD